MSAIKVRLVRGYQSCNRRQCETVWGLGLYRLGDERLLPDHPAILGMARKVPHLVAWEKVDDKPTAPRHQHGGRSKGPGRVRARPEPVRTAMDLHTLAAPKGSRTRRTRVGRGQGSGLGKTAGRGGKGQRARTGNMNLLGFEGGQMPLTRRMPKYGFHNPFRRDVAVVNLGALARFADGETVDVARLVEAGLVKGRPDAVKILGGGDLKRKLVVQAHAFSASAKDRIAALGGRAEVLAPAPKPPPPPPPARAGRP